VCYLIIKFDKWDSIDITPLTSNTGNVVTVFTLTENNSQSCFYTAIMSILQARVADNAVTRQ